MNASQDVSWSFTAWLSGGTRLTRISLSSENDAVDCLSLVAVFDGVLLLTASIQLFDLVDQSITTMEIPRFLFSVLPSILSFFVRSDRRRPCSKLSS